MHLREALISYPGSFLGFIIRMNIWTFLLVLYKPDKLNDAKKYTKETLHSIQLWVTFF